MKINKKTACRTLFTLIIGLLVLSGTNVLAQRSEVRETSDFKIIIDSSGEKVEMTCISGCAWKELAFSKITYKPQTINASGLINSKSPQVSNDPNLANFLFTIEITKKGVSLEGKEGTAWKKLGFTSTNQAINQMGMTTLN